MIRVEILRSKWQRGVRGGQLLVSPQHAWDYPGTIAGRKCCLGFVCSVLGVSDDQLLDVGMPAGLRINLPSLVRYRPGTFNESLPWVFDAARINDDPDISEQVREASLKELAAENGFEFVFV